MATDDLSEEERRALRGSKFAPLPSKSTSSRSQPRLAHPGGPLKTNKAAALAKFLHRKLHQNPHGLNSIDPQILELAVQNAKASLPSCGTSGSGSGTNIRHVDSFDDPEGSFDEGEAMNSEPKKLKKNKKNKKKKNNKRQKIVEDSECGVGKKHKKNLKL